MLTGSLVSSIQGDPRVTHDIDLVISIESPVIPLLFNALREPRFYLDLESMHEALRHQNMFNLIDMQSGDKIDFFMLTADAYDQTRFARRQTEILFGVSVPLTTPEDTILSKLIWAKKSGGSEKQIRDVEGVYRFQKPTLDIPYIEKWVEHLGIQEFWLRITKS
jgi:hypothetical protein